VGRYELKFNSHNNFYLSSKLNFVEIRAVVSKIKQADRQALSPHYAFISPFLSTNVVLYFSTPLPGV
jgi:hypothetical protein